MADGKIGGIAMTEENIKTTVKEEKNILVEDLKAHIEYLKFEKIRLEGVIEGLKFAIRCNGVSGGDVHD